MMPGLTGRLYQQFALTISVATVFSSVNALTLAPALCGMLLRPSPAKRPWVFEKFNEIFDRTTVGYTGRVGWMISHLRVSMLAFAGLLVATFFALTAIPGGFIPDEDQGYFYVNVQLPDGASAERTREVLNRINEWVEELPAIRGYITVGGYSFLTAVQASNYGAMIVVTEEWDERQSPELTVPGLIAGLQARVGRGGEAQGHDALGHAFEGDGDP